MTAVIYLSLVVIIETAMLEKFSRNEHGADLVGMHSVPCDKGGVLMLEIAVEHGLRVDENTAVLLCESFASRTVFVHAGAHGVGRIGLHVVGRHEEHALDAPL